MSKLSTKLANRFNIEPNTFIKTVKATCFNGQHPSNEQFAQFLMIAEEYKLNPFLKEIYAFPTQGGGVQPIVGVDGWLQMINRHSEFDGMEFDDKLDSNGNLISVTCRVHRKDRKKPTEVTEYMSECLRNTNTWKQWPARMLRHKATIQAARYAFGFSGIVDPDEGERIISSVGNNGQPVINTAAVETITDEQAADVVTLLEEVNADRAKFAQWIQQNFKATSIKKIPADKLDEVIVALEAKKQRIEPEPPTETASSEEEVVY